MSWRAAIADEYDDRRLDDLLGFVEAERVAGKTIYPPPGQVFAALNRTPLPAVRAVILGQDPYIRPGQAHGFAFSVPRGVPKPPSLRNVLTELSDEFGYPPPGHGCLTDWADQGVLLLNRVLTVEAGQSGSHAGRGWEAFTSRIIRAVDAQAGHAAFLLWGAEAAKAAPADRCRTPFGACLGTSIPARTREVLRFEAVHRHQRVLAGPPGHHDRLAA